MVLLAPPGGAPGEAPRAGGAGGRRGPAIATDVVEVVVTSRSRRRIRVSSHFPFDRVNPRLEFDREAAHGFRLDLPAGAYEGWEPGETKRVRLVRYAGAGEAG